MRAHGYDEESEVIDEEQIIEQVLGENPRARDMRLMRMTLEDRRNGMRREHDRTSDGADKARLTAKIVELEKQIAVLRQEEEITQFVESSVRVTLHQSAVDEFDE